MQLLKRAPTNEARGVSDIVIKSEAYLYQIEIVNVGAETNACTVAIARVKVYRGTLARYESPIEINLIKQALAVEIAGGPVVRRTSLHAGRSLTRSSIMPVDDYRRHEGMAREFDRSMPIYMY